MPADLWLMLKSAEKEETQRRQNEGGEGKETEGKEKKRMILYTFQFGKEVW